MISEDVHLNMETDSPDKLTNPNRISRFLDEMKKDNTRLTEYCRRPPPIVPDLDKCRQHKELSKDIKMMNGCLAFLEHCIRSEKEFPELANDDALATYQKAYDDLVSLKEHKMGELALFLPCPVLDCPDSQNTPTNSNAHTKNNVKKHARKASKKNRKSPNPTPVPSDGFASPKKFAKKIKLILLLDLVSLLH
ncbi:hypothetical protein TNIN_340321 [Trichonephila inaurata madagascariensis]|uniref:Uncharacterized protein n=1 Tax=Trichonephila inaurata madagascariensis TaxID=2747483 RepID=A0A8X7C767_9ARAC|nr:hypothetical protein TNIN_340321 [Trichonephila inaurata madagascariensis]